MPYPSRCRARRLAAALAAAAVLAPVAAAPADAAGPKVTVMSRNLYLGADIIPLAAAQTREAFEQAAAQRWQTVQATNFPQRAKEIAAEIKAKRPDVIGIQEGALWRRSPDGVKDGAATPATIVVYDFLATLQKELKARGLRYRVVKKQNELDIEAPTALGYDIRLTQQDAILAKSGVKVRNAKSRNYAAALTVPTQIGAVRILRGWLSVDATIRGETFRFVDTHLEAYSGGVSGAQAKELLSKKGPTRTRMPVVLVGDLNSDPTDPAPGSDAYKAIARSFTDVLKRARRTGATCCQAEDLRNPTSMLNQRIDFILTKPRLRILAAALFGNRPANRISGLWPSDHAGLDATLRLP
jgi:endonuclease/exonuclease/phosphatase family metal-dependent hydrolase